MDLDDWELIHGDDDLFMDFDDDDDDGLIPWETPFRASKRKQQQPMFQPKVFIDMNYLENFNDPIKKNSCSSRVSDESLGEVNVFPDQITIDSAKIGSLGSEKEKISMVSLEGTNGNQFANMKLDSPKSINSGISPGSVSGTDRFEGGCGGFDGENGAKGVIASVDEERVSFPNVSFHGMKENQFVDMKSEYPVLDYEGFSSRNDVGIDRFEKNGGDLDGENEALVKGEERVIQVLFRSNMKENESVDTKSESSILKNEGIYPPIIVATDRFEEKGADEYVLEQDVKFKDAKLKDEGRFSQVLFRDMENEFADMVLKSPTSKNMGFFPQDSFEDNSCSDESADGKERSNGSNESVDEDSHWCLNTLKKWGISGFGAFCTFGFAAATIGMVLLSSGQKENREHPIPKIHYQVYSDHDKRIKRIMHRAKELNEAILAVRGTHIARAHITVGGYFEGF